MSRKECPPTKILNPKTGRCVNRDGKIGKQILGNKVSYEQCDSKLSGDCVIHPRTLQYVTLPKNTIIYRGISTDTQKELKNYLFFAGSNIANIYGDMDIQRLKLKQNIKLVDMNNVSNIKNIRNKLTGEDLKLFDIYFSIGINQFTPNAVYFNDNTEMKVRNIGCTGPDTMVPYHVCTEGYINNEDKVDSMYISRKLLKVFCTKLKLDGWIHYGLLPRSRVYDFEPFHDEIGICNPGKVLGILGTTHSK